MPSGLLVEGAWLEEGEPVNVLDEYALEPVGRVRTATPRHVTRAVTAVASAVTGNSLDARERSSILERAAARWLDTGTRVAPDYVYETGFTQGDGAKDSGYGLEGPKYAVEDMSVSRTIVLNRTSSN